MKKLDQEIILAEGFEYAFLGIGRREGQPLLAIYSVKKALDILREQGYTAEEAREFFETHSMGVWLGVATPIWVEEMTTEELRGMSLPAPCREDTVH